MGSVRFDREGKLLTGPEGEYHLGPELANLIEALIDSVGEVVTREELIDKVWQGSIGADTLLTFNIQRLRKFLGDSSKKPMFIETIPGHGYRLVAPVQPEPGHANGQQSLTTTQEILEPSSSLWQFLVELRKRKVCRAALMYALAVWLVCQVAEVLFDALSFPEWAFPMIVVIGILGFPIALILAWTFEVTPNGLALDIPTVAADSGSSSKHDVRVNSAMLAASVIVSAQMLLFGFDLVEYSDDEMALLKKAETVIVTPFRATSVSLETKAYAFVLSEEVRHLLRAEYKLDVISAEGLAALTAEQKRADLLLQGSVALVHGGVQIIVHLVDPNNGHDLWSDMIFVPASGTDGSQHRIARQMLRELPIGYAVTAAKVDPVVAGRSD